MDQTELVKLLNAITGKVKVTELSRILTGQNFNLPDLIAITLHPDADIAFRAAWLLENVFLQRPEKYLPDLEYLLSQMLRVKAAGGKRHYAKIVMHITEPNAAQLIRDKVNDVDFEPIIEQLFDWMIDPQIKIAVKVCAAQALFNLRHRYNWLAEELADQLQFLMRDGTAAIQSKGKKLLRELAGK
jgi:hypothetical protein